MKDGREPVGNAPRGGPGGTILVLYYADRAPLRVALRDHLYALGRYAPAPTVYVNLAVRGLPLGLARHGIGMVVFHTSLLAQRWHPPTFQRLRRKLGPLRERSWTTIAIPQDEFIHTDLLCDFIREFRVDHVLTCAAPNDVKTIYGDLDDGLTRFTRVLTGYLDPASVTHIEDLSTHVERRDIDVAYRAWRPEFWLGRHAQLKAAVGDVFAAAAPAAGMKTDISLRDEDTLVGDDWYRLLLRARWTIGVEGGATAIDRDGSIRQRTLEYTRDHPGASFDETEAVCFPGVDGTLGLITLSPRHLEACATRTAQVLIEGDYNGVLQAGVHFLALKSDFSNLRSVLDAMQDEVVRETFAARAFRDIVASHRFDYPALATEISALGLRPTDDPNASVATLLIGWGRVRDQTSWWWVAIRQRVRPALRALLQAMGLLAPLRRLRSAADATEGRS